MELKSTHGLVPLTIFGAWAVHHVYMAGGVMKARKKYDVKYPLLYAPDGNPNAEAFNCVQRAHQNSLENLPIFLALLGAAGVPYPSLASAAGAVYLAGRVAYFQGYSTGEPAKRMRGSFMYAGLLTLLGATVTFGVSLLRGQR